MSAKSTRRRRARTRRKRRSRNRSRPAESASRRPAARSRATAQHRIEAAFSALSDNTRKAYRCAWTAWQRWAAEHRCRAQPATAADVADYLQALHANGAAPATIRVARAAIAKVHQVSGLADPTVDSLCRAVLRRIGREGRNRGRGQVVGIGWAQAEAAAVLAEGSGSLQGLRDGAIIRLMSDTLARVSEVAALQCSDVEPETITSGGTVHIRASKSDQHGDGSTRYIGAGTPPARCSGGCGAAATAARRRSAPTASGRSCASES